MNKKNCDVTGSVTAGNDWIRKKVEWILKKKIDILNL